MQPKKKVLVISPFPQGVAAGQRLKYEQYFDHWRDNGYEVVVSSFMDTPICQTLATFFLEIILKNSSMTISNRRTQANRQSALYTKRSQSDWISSMMPSDQPPRIFKDCT